MLELEEDDADDEDDDDEEDDEAELEGEAEEDDADDGAADEDVTVASRFGALAFGSDCNAVTRSDHSCDTVGPSSDILHNTDLGPIQALIVSSIFVSSA